MAILTSNSFILPILVVFSVLIFSTEALLSGTDIEVTAGDLGKIKGVGRQTVVSKRDFIDFLGIPYAKAPVNESRFLPAEPIEGPLAAPGETFNATKKMDCCPQHRTNLLCALTQSENCLGLHISTPQIEGKYQKLFPVIVFIHGGAFTLGSSDTYNGARLLERDVVVVTVNYRLGVLGFFCLNTASVPGNAAMYDLFEALVWVNKYISYFGGDPNSVTIAGQSAGSVAVSHLLLSPLTRDKGLFHRAISLSGTSLNEWGTTTPEIAEEASLEIARRVGCNDPGSENNPDAIASCMRKVPIKNLTDTLETYQREERKQGRLGFSPVTPIVQRVGPASGAKFLDEDPEVIMEQTKQANVPLIMGSTRHDGSFVLSIVHNQFLKLDNLQHNSTFLKTQMVPMLLKALGINDRTEAVYDTLANVYLGKDIKSSGNFSLMIPGLTDLHSIFFFKAAAFRTLKLHSRIQPNSYWYSFDFKGTKSLYGTLVNLTGNPVPGGVTHGDDLIYLFNILTMGHTTPEEKAVSARMVNYWANFATTGDPNKESMTTITEDGWPTFSEEDPNYAVLNKEDEFPNEFPAESWQGVSYELLPELFPPDTFTTSPSVDKSTLENIDDKTTPENIDDKTTPENIDDKTTSENIDEKTSTDPSDGHSEASTEDVESTTAGESVNKASMSLFLITVSLVSIRFFSS